VNGSLALLLGLVEPDGVPGRQVGSPAAPPHQGRRGHGRALLKDGRVLAVGGVAGTEVLDRAEIYDPAANSWTPVAPMHQARFDLTLTTLADGRVLAAGGAAPSPAGGNRPLASAEVFDPASGSWSAVRDGMATPRSEAAAASEARSCCARSWASPASLKRFTSWAWASPAFVSFVS